jgi:hypothetical protein
MGLITTSCLLGLSAMLFAVASWRAAKPADPLKPRLAPWRALIIFSGAFSMLLIVHLFNLMGVETGRGRL